MAWVITIQAEQGLPEWLFKNGSLAAPESGIWDRSGFFTPELGSSQKISDQLKNLEKAHGYKIYLVVEPVLIGTSTSQMAAELRQALLPKGDGVVLVFEADSRSLGIGRDLGVHPDSPAASSVIPTHETAELITRATEGVDASLAPEAYVEALTVNLVKECSAYFARRNAPPPPGRALKLNMLMLGILALLTLVGIGVGWIARHWGMADVRRFHFPPVDLPERLGAPCGSSVTARSFEPRSASRS
jgi:hypothetical protein